MHAPALYRPDCVPRVDGGNWFGCGSGFRVHGAVLAQGYRGSLSRTDADAVPNAAAMLRLALPVFAAGQGLDAAAAAPLYVRDKVALKSSER
jgi:tRNA threonylcarbamoyladenosine biosynthesis protein TsaB